MREVIAICLLLLSCTPVAAQPPDHSPWDQLLKRNVTPEGWVNYKGFIQDRSLLEAYLKAVSTKAPDPQWTPAEQLAYWINVYNAYTVKLIIDHYPLKSIKDLNAAISIPGVQTIWKDRFFTIGGKPFSLDDIEHTILRKQFHEPRIHFAINCASVSCPVLRNEAYRAGNIDDQLQQQAIRFINDPLRNKISKEEARLSQIFNWYVKDFVKKGTLLEFVNQYAVTKAGKAAKISFLEYDWRLNEE